MFFIVVLLIRISHVLGVTEIYLFNYTFNPKVNNVTVKIFTTQLNTFNFSYDLNVTNLMDVYNETSKAILNRSQDNILKLI